MNGRGFDAYLVVRIKIRLGRRASSRRRRGFRLGTYVVSTGSPGHHTWVESSHAQQADGTCQSESAPPGALAEQHLRRNENNRVTRVLNLDTFCHWQGRVPSGDKLSHIVGLGFPLLWLIAKCRGAGVCWESHAVSVESHQSRVRARLCRPDKTKERYY